MRTIRPTTARSCHVAFAAASSNLTPFNRASGIALTYLSVVHREVLVPQEFLCGLEHPRSTGQLSQYRCGPTSASVERLPSVFLCLKRLDNCPTDDASQVHRLALRVREHPALTWIAVFLTPQRQRKADGCNQWQRCDGTLRLSFTDDIAGHCTPDVNAVMQSLRNLPNAALESLRAGVRGRTRGQQ